MSFAAARLAFADVFAVVREDRRQNYGEDRFILLGMVEERLLAVAYSIRGLRDTHYFGTPRRATRATTLP